MAWFAAAIPYIATAAGVGSTIYGVTSSRKASKSVAKSTPQIEPIKPPPSIDVQGVQEEAQTMASSQGRMRQMAMRRNRTIFTNPLGISGQAETIKKKLLGQ